MSKVLTEKQYQRYIIDYLVEKNGYIERTDANFDRYYAIDKELLLQFLCDTQLDEVIKLKKIYIMKLIIKWLYLRKLVIIQCIVVAVVVEPLGLKIG